MTVLTELLIKAAERNDVATCEKLIEDGANVNGEVLVMTPLHAAAKAGSVDAVRFLLQAGANVRQCLRGRNGVNGEEALDLAMWAGSVEASKVLIAAGADPLRERSFMGSPFHQAVADGKVELIEAILDFGVSSAAVVPNAPDDLTPFQFAVQRRQHAVIACIARRGAEDLAQRTAGGKTLLQLARGDKATLALLRSFKTEHGIARLLTGEGGQTECIGECEKSPRAGAGVPAL